LLFVLLIAFSAGAAENGPPKPGPRDKCPVCGMLVEGFPNWVSTVVFKDGSRAFFDGPKDMFKYVLDLKRYNPKKQPSDIADLFVTDYYTLAPIEARKAWYVAGSDVQGPMGGDLVPLAKEADAKAFMKDHKGRKVLRFEDVTLDVIRNL
jgi:nitrous oxide reductase accessory protein NosL